MPGFPAPRFLIVSVLLTLAGCSAAPLRSPDPAVFCRRESLAAPSKTSAQLVFTRAGRPSGPITVRLGWLPNPDPAFYTPRGVMREVSISEGGRSVSVPVERLHGIEDLWPGLVHLVSARPGDYRLYLPQGVGAGPSHPDAVVVRGYKFTALLTPAPEYADDSNPPYP